MGVRHVVVTVKFASSSESCALLAHYSVPVDGRIKGSLVATLDSAVASMNEREESMDEIHAHPGQQGSDSISTVEYAWIDSALGL